MSITVLQWRPLYLAIALLFFTGGQVVAQATAADQNFKAIPQQIKANAENKANIKANNLANSATDKLDSGMNKALKGIGKMFKKKPKPGKDSLAVPVVPAAPVASKTDSTVVPKTSFLSGGQPGLGAEEGLWVTVEAGGVRGKVVPAWARKCEVTRSKQVS
jgi:hypothetical protein